jgi:PIN domain nuclease of toxin-antitoxin system
VTSVVLDTHVLLWWSSEPEKVSPSATAAITAADDVAVADITWFELARLAHKERVVVAIPIVSWLHELARLVRTIPVSPSIAAAAALLPASFPGDAADRLIYATAIENGCPLVTKDDRLLTFKHPRRVAVW